MAINISTDIAVTTGGKLTDIGSIQGGWRSVATYSDMAALTGSATLKGKLQNGQVFYIIDTAALYSLTIAGSVPFQTYTFNAFSWPGSGGSSDLTALNNFTGSIQTEVDSLTSSTSSYSLVTDVDLLSSSIETRLTSLEGSSGIFALTGSVYATTNNLEVTGSLTINEGVLQLSEYRTTPTVVDGGIIYSASNFYFGMP